jgi:hypothetical protein
MRLYSQFSKFEALTLKFSKFLRLRRRQVHPLTPSTEKSADVASLLEAMAFLSIASLTHAF